MSDHIKLILKTLPEKPGVYRFYDDKGTVIYVGKAKRLKRRVSSYFNKDHDSAKVRMLVTKIRDIQTVVVDTEWDALLLENSMIKEFKPKYNIMLKDDKTYPWIAVTREPFARIFPTRRPDPAKMHLFGPYSSVRQMNILLELLNDMFPLRTCKILRNNDRPCMQYQIKKCAAPCCGLITAEKYQENIEKAIQIIKGNRKEVIRQLKEEMMQYAEEWKFEQAAEVKQKIEALENFIGKSVVVNPALTNMDVFGMEEDDNCTYISFLRVIDGAVVQAHTLEIDNRLETTAEDALWTGILEMKERLGGLSPTLLVPFMPSLAPEDWDLQVPQRGDKRKLLELATHNAHFYMLEKKKRQDLADPERRNMRVLQALQEALGMKTLPRRIECFDNSNTQGEEPVAAMSCFIDGKPAKSEYRHFNIKTVVGADDFASMEEVIYRRYHRLLEENKPLPDLVVIDGGKGQRATARRLERHPSVAHRRPADDGRHCKTTGGHLQGRRRRARLYRQTLRSTKIAATRARRGTPFRHHPPSQAPQQNQHRLHPRRRARNRQSTKNQTVKRVQKRLQNRRRHRTRTRRHPRPQKSR